MNILFLDIDPKMCAYAHCDEDVKKKLETYTRLLTNAHFSLDSEGEILKSLDPPVVHFPEASWWVELNKSNYQWLHDLWFWINKEYWWRYDNMHEVWSKFYNKLSHLPNNIKEGELTAPPKCAHESSLIFSVEGLEDDIQNAVESYRKFYTNYCKENDAKWGGIVDNMRTPPSWILEDANI